MLISNANISSYNSLAGSNPVPPPSTSFAQTSLPLIVLTLIFCLHLIFASNKNT